MNYGKVAYGKAVNLERQFYDLSASTKKVAENTLNFCESKTLGEADNDVSFVFSCAKTSAVLFDFLANASFNADAVATFWLNGIKMGEKACSTGTSVVCWTFCCPEVKSGLNTFRAEFTPFDNAVVQTRLNVCGSYVEDVGQAQTFCANTATPLLGYTKNNQTKLYEGSLSSAAQTFSFDDVATQTAVSRFGGNAVLFRLVGSRLTAIFGGQSTEICSGVSHFAATPSFSAIFTVSSAKLRFAPLVGVSAVTTQLCSFVGAERVQKVFVAEDGGCTYVGVQSSARFTVWKSQNLTDWQQCLRAQTQFVVGLAVSGDSVTLLTLKNKLCVKNVYAPQQATVQSAVCFAEAACLLSTTLSSVFSDGKLNLTTI